MGQKDVYLLGAGFSRAVSDRMPLLDELSKSVRLDVLGPQEEYPPLSENLELWLSYLSQPQPWLHEIENLRNQALALELTEAIAHTLSDRERQVVGDKCPDWLGELVRHWHRTKANVISLNYDTLVEWATPKVIQDMVPPSAPAIYPITLTSLTPDSLPERRFWAGETLTLFKLHGSINWFYSGLSNFAGEVLYYMPDDLWRRERWDLGAARRVAMGKVPLIVPPTAEKTSLLQHESLRSIWYWAAMSIHNADRIFALGYSLPPTDLAIRLFLLDRAHGPMRKRGGVFGNWREASAVDAGRKVLYVVNIDESILRHYQNLLGDAFEIRDDYIGNDAVKKLVQETC